MYLSIQYQLFATIVISILLYFIQLIFQWIIVFILPIFPSFVIIQTNVWNGRMISSILGWSIFLRPPEQITVEETNKVAYHSFVVFVEISIASLVVTIKEIAYFDSFHTFDRGDIVQCCCYEMENSQTKCHDWKWEYYYVYEPPYNVE